MEKRDEFWPDFLRRQIEDPRTSPLARERWRRDLAELGTHAEAERLGELMRRAHPRYRYDMVRPSRATPKTEAVSCACVVDIGDLRAAELRREAMERGGYAPMGGAGSPYAYWAPRKRRTA
jgi:hypothetical protein